MHPLFKKLRSAWGITLRDDLMAGLTTAILLVPQAMAYATLAGLPPVTGLYASTVPLLMYAWLGSSRVMAVGPVALVSLMTAAALLPLKEAGATEAELIGAAGLLALMVGGLQLLMGVLRINGLTKLLSRPVLTGFTAAAALLIGWSQVPTLVGSGSSLTVPWQWNLPTLAVGLGSLAGLLLLRKIKRSLPAALIVLVLTTLAVIFLSLAERGVTVVGAVPAGLPGLAIPPLDLALATALIASAVAIALVSYLEGFAVAKALAKKGQKINAGREWIGIGAANASAGLIGGYPLAGGFSRSAVNSTAGAKTRLAGAITALLVMAALAFLTPLFTSLPRAALAAIIVVAVAGLLHVKDWKLLHKEGRRPLGVALITFATTMVFNIEAGLVVGIIASQLSLRLFGGQADADAPEGNIDETIVATETEEEEQDRGNTAIFPAN